MTPKLTSQSVLEVTVYISSLKVNQSKKHKTATKKMQNYDKDLHMTTRRQETTTKTCKMTT